MIAQKRAQGNSYDKIFKENMDASFQTIIEHTMGLHVVNSVEMTGDIQHTRERKPDVLRKVTDQHDYTYILHMELQSRNEKDMIYRMVEYRVMLQRKYRVPVKQYVLYTGRDKLSMITSISEEDFTFKYKIVTLHEVDYKKFLQKETPEERVLAILSNFGEDPEDVALTAIAKAVIAVADGRLEVEKFTEQLRLLSQLREPKIKAENMRLLSPDSYTMETDPVYVTGTQNGIIEAKTQTAVKMKQQGADPMFIASVTELSIEQIQTL